MVACPEYEYESLHVTDKQDLPGEEDLWRFLLVKDGSAKPDLPCIGSIAADQVVAFANRRVRENEEGSKDAFIGGTVRPCLPLLFVTVVLKIVFAPILICWRLLCVAKDEQTPVWWICLFIPFVVTLLCIEFRCLQHYVVTFTQRVGVFRIFGQIVSFPVWFLYSFMQTNVNALNVATNALFVAAWIVKSRDAHSQRLLHQVLGHNINVPFVLLVVIVKMLEEIHLIAKVALLCPRSSQETPPRQVSDKPPFGYRNICGDDCFVGAVFFSLSHGAGFASISGTAFAFRKGWIEHKPGSDSEAWCYLQCMMNFNGLCSYMKYSVIPDSFGRIAAPLHLQILMFSVQRALNPADPRLPHALFSIVVAALAALPPMLTMLEFLAMCPKVLRINRETSLEERCKLPAWYRGPTGKQELNLWRLWSMVVLAMLWISTILYAVFRMAMVYA